jgi:PBP1b-binding outer membrane lipoprotein LpoB|tara:strand:+ start:992 stop:1120 length:129 start_codon:yes stop_codon:yes gene_type:complete
MKKVVLISALFLASCSQITDVANGVGGAAGNVMSSVADAVGL